MPFVTFLPQNIRVEAASGASLLDAAHEAGAILDAECGGEGVCGKCRVRIVSGPIPPGSADFLPQNLLDAGCILACKAALGDEDLIVETTAASRGQGQFAEDAVDEAAVPDRALSRPLAQRFHLAVPPAAPEDGLADADRFAVALGKALPECVGRAPDIPLPVLRTLAQTLRREDGRVSATLALRGENARIIDISPGHDARSLLGAAVDIGTTSVTVSLLDLQSGARLASQSDFNAQISRGLDVISRINYAARPERLEELRRLVLDTINRLVREAAASKGFAPEDIVAAVLAGNTVMSHLVLGLPPEHIRLEPYTPTVREFPTFIAEALGLCMHPRAEIFLSPCVGSYVGGDIVSGLLTTNLAGDASDPEAMELFLDIGTNGELAVGGADFLMTCACSAGPAFEGGGVSCGMPAGAGAVERISIDPQTGALALSVIGGGAPKGLCGSGMISLIAELFRAGLLDPAGKFDRSGASPRIRVDGRRAVFTLAEAAESATDAPLVVNETDVENLIRAKAAIYCACDLLLTHIGLTFDDVATFSIAGGFGRFLNLEDAVTIGLLPDVDRAKFRFLGNACLTGARLALLSEDRRAKQIELARSMTYAELMTSPEYMDGYTAALFLPHTDGTRFPSVKKG
jgi:uncharacterized 2Fe-2S/4Fe-4S cluster protein (DUF4445 family)